MFSFSDIVLIFAILMNLLLLSSNRMRSCILIAASQGAMIGLLPLLVSPHGLNLRLLLVALVTIALKGIVFPKMLFLAVQRSTARHEVRPAIGFCASTLIGLALVVLSFWLASQFTLPRPVVSDLVLPVSLSTIMCGLLVIITRRQAMLQVVGFLILENGVYIFGIALAHEEPLLVEMGILLEVFAAVFVMGIAVFHIINAFDDRDVEHLAQLRD